MQANGNRKASFFVKCEYILKNPFCIGEGTLLKKEGEQGLEDVEIVNLYWDRNETAIRESDAKYGNMLLKIAYNILSNREDSEECVNDTYGKAWASIPPQKPRSLAAYLGRIVRNLSINRWYAIRAQKRGGENLLLSELAECIPSQSNVEREAEAREITKSVEQWLYTLPKADRVLFLRRYWFGDDLKTLAAEHAASPNKIAGRLYRLRQKLKSALEKDGVVL